MTINEEVPIHIYTGNGTATEFSYTFTIFDETDIVLTLLTIASGVETNITSNYSVNDTLKKVTYPVSGSPLTSAYKLVISRNVPDEQDINFTSSGAFNTTNITESFDKATMNIQEVKEVLSRCVKWKISTAPIITTDAEDFLGGGSGTTPGSTTWGDIGGTLSNQTDLNDALAGKSATTHSHSSTYQALDTQLTALAGTTSQADALPYYNSSNTASTTTFTSLARTLIGASTTAAMRSTLEVGTGGVTAYSDLTGTPSTFAPSNHDHASNQLAQSNTHQSPDTDSGTTSLHHTLGSGTYQASPGNHNHSSTYSNLVGTTTDGNFTAFSGTAGTLRDSGYSYSTFATAGHNHSATYQSLDTELTAIAGLTSASDTAPYFTGSGTASLMTVTSAGRAILDDANAAAQRVTIGVSVKGIYVTIDGGTSTPTTGSRARVTIPIACTITNWYVVADASGSCVVDVKRSGTTIIGAGNKPTLSSAQRANAAVASWTSVAIAANDELEFNLDSVTTCKQIYITLVVTV